MKIISIVIVGLILSFSSFSQTNTGIANLDSASLKKQDTIPYAILYFYRSYVPKMNASLKNVPIYIDDSLVYSLKANRLIGIKLYKEGKHNIAVDKKGETEIASKFKLGTEYFFRCDIVKGLWFGKPVIDAVTPKVGKDESGVFKNE